MNNRQKEQLIDHLRQFVTPHKQALIRKLLPQRTRYLTVVLENIYQPHNASAVLRSCDCFGVQDAHIIENEYEYRINPDVAMGATKWLTLHRYRRPDLNNTGRCLTRLKEQGYKIAATTLREDSISLFDLPLDQKVALCFGTEEHGLSAEAHDLADVNVQIPMYGFTQSFNISVSAALCLFHLRRRLEEDTIDWALPADEQTDLTIEWLRKATNKGDAMARYFYNQHGIPLPNEPWALSE